MPDSSSRHRRRILIIVASLTRGGAERAAANFSKVLHQCFDVTILTFHGRATYSFGGEWLSADLPYDPHASLVTKPLRLKRKLSSTITVARKIGAEAILSFGDGPNIIAVLAGTHLRIPVITNTQHDVTMSYKRIRQRLVYQLMLRQALSRATASVALSTGVRDQLEREYAVPARKLHVIHNPIDTAEISERLHERIPQAMESFGGKPTVLAVGRLSAEKRHTLLLESFAELRKTTDCRLAIIGDGELRGALESQTAQLAIRDSVDFLGWQSNPFLFMQRSSVLALTSEYEGFANVLVEAMAVGCPVVSVDCPHGPREIAGATQAIKLTGQSAHELKCALQDVISQPEIRERLVTAGKSRAQDFSLERLGPQYTALVQSTIESHGKPTRAMNLH